MKALLGKIEKYLIKCVNLLLQIIFIITAPLFYLYNKTNHALPSVKTSESGILLCSGVQLANMIRERKVTCEEAMLSFIERIKAVSPVVNAVVSNRFSAALEEAKALDVCLQSTKEVPEEYSAKNKPFLGVPFTLKEAFAVKGMPNTSGLLARQSYIAQEDASVVQKMRKAGAIPIAVTNCSELCMWYESSNLIYGRCNNPYHTGHIAGGSSGGEGVNQSCAGAPIGIGSDIGGSIRMPAYFTGIFGHKGTTGVINNNGQWPLALNEGETFLSTGPMCRYAQDLLPVLKTIIKEEHGPTLKLNQPVDLKKIKVFYQQDDGGSLCSPVHPEIKACIKKAAVYLASATGRPAQECNISKFQLSLQMWSSLMSTSGSNKFCLEMGNMQRHVRPLVELWYWLTARPRHTLPAILLGLAEKVPMPDYAVKGLRSIRDKLRQDLTDMLGEDGVFLYPTHPLPAPWHNQPLLVFANFAYTGIFNVLGLPCTAVPMGLSKGGLPIGLQVVGAPNMDRLTIAVAEELERGFGGWVPPFKVEQ